MASGIICDPEVGKVFSDLQEKHLHRFLTLKFNDDYRKVVVDQIGAKDATFSDLLAIVPRDHIRYILYDCEYKTNSGQDRSKVLLVNWSSDDDAPLKEKMLITSTANSVKNVCKKVAKVTTINEWDDLTEENFINIVSDNRTK